MMPTVMDKSHFIFMLSSRHEEQANCHLGGR
jgi:hypothetical protein